MLKGVKTLYLKELLANLEKELSKKNRNSKDFFDKKRQVSEIKEELKLRK